MTTERLAELRAVCAAATAGDWTWIVNPSSNRIELSGRGIVVLCPVRWGMRGADFTLVTMTDRGAHLLRPAHELAVEIPGREHHKDWAMTLDHPDATFIAAARTALPEALGEVDRLRKLADRVALRVQTAAGETDGAMRKAMLQDAMALLEEMAPHE